MQPNAANCVRSRNTRKSHERRPDALSYNADGPQEQDSCKRQHNRNHDIAKKDFHETRLPLSYQSPFITFRITKVREIAKIDGKGKEPCQSSYIRVNIIAHALIEQSLDSSGNT